MNKQLLLKKLDEILPQSDYQVVVTPDKEKGDITITINEKDNKSESNYIIED